MQIIDTHAHWYPQEFIDLLDREAANNGGKMTRNEKGGLNVDFGPDVKSAKFIHQMSISEMVDAKVDARWDEILGKALAKEPDARYASVRDMAQAVRDAPVS